MASSPHTTTNLFGNSLRVDMSGHDGLQYVLQCSLGIVTVREAAAQQEKELKAIKDKQTEDKWQAIIKRHANAGTSWWEVRAHDALALDATRG